MRVLWGDVQIWPTNADEWFVADGITFMFAENTQVDETTYPFRFEGYNNDCAYPHTIYFRLTIVPQEPDPLSRLLQFMPRSQVVRG